MTDVRVTPQSWLWKPRTKPIRLLEIHATRGNTTPAQQMQAALNWVQSPSNGSAAQGWGSSFSHVIGADGSQGTVLDDNQMPTYSAGYGGAGSTYAIDEYAISYECAQSQALEPFTDQVYARLAQEVAIDCLKYDIPPVMIEVLNQRGAVPTGIVRHDRCENGVKLGKTDPGAQFDEARFIADVKAEMEPATPIEEDEMPKPVLINTASDGTHYLTDWMSRWPVSGPVLEELRARNVFEGGSVDTIPEELMAAIPLGHGPGQAGGGASSAEVADEFSKRLAS